MKQKLRVFCTLLLLAVASVGWAEEELLLDFSSNNGQTPAANGIYMSTTNGTFKKVLNDVDYQFKFIEGDYSSISHQKGQNAIQLGSSKKPIGNYVIALQTSLENISKVVVKAYANSGATLSIGVGNSEGSIIQEFTSSDNDYVDVNKSTSTSGEYVFTGNATTGNLILSGSVSSNYLRIQSIIITYGNQQSEQTVAPPTFSPTAGTYTSAQNVTLSCATEGSTIYYTTDGTDPTDGSTEYTAPINVAINTTIKAIAYVGEDASSIAEATYTILTPTTIDVARSAENDATVCTGGTVTSVSGSTAYIQDATAAIVLYGGNTNTLSVGDQVTVCGTKTVFNGLVEITNAQNAVLSQNNEVTPALKTIEEINSDYAGANALQAMLVKIEDATVTAIDGDNTTIAQDENTINIYKLSTEVSVNDKITSFVANIGCHNGVQLVNAKDVVVEQATEPAIVVETTAVELGQGNAEGTIEVTYQNVNNENAGIAFYAADGETIATYDWITAELNDDKNIEYLVEANTGAARTAYMKVYSLDAEGNDVYSDLITITQAAYAVDYAELPFEWAGGASSAFNDLAGVTTSGLGSDYAASNAPYLIKLDNTGDYIMVKTDSRPGKVTINVKMLGGANTSSITIQGSSDGSEFSDVEELEIAGAQNTVLTLETSKDFAENDRYVKLIFTRGSNVGVGAITIAKYTTSASITVAETEVLLTAAESDGTIGVTYKNLAATPEVLFFAADGTTEAEYDWILAEIDGNNISYMVSENTGEARTAYMKVHGHDAEENDVYSDLITVTQAAAVTPGTGDSYQLFSGDLVEGDYIICYAGKAMNTTVTSDRLQYEEVTPSNDVITTDNAAIVWHIAKSGDYWTIYNAGANAYAAGTGAKNKAQMLEDGTDDKALWTVSGTETYDFVNKANAAANVNANLRNNGTYGFACYAAGTGGALSLYKKVEDIPQPETIDVNIGESATGADGAYYSSVYYRYKALQVPEGVVCLTYKVDGGALTVSKTYAAGSVIPADEAVVIKASDAGKVNFVVTTTTEQKDAYSMLLGCDEATTIREAGCKYYKLTLNAANEEGTAGFYFDKGVMDGSTINAAAHKCYLRVPVDQTNGAKGFVFGEETDGIGQIENGELTIENSVVYDLSGRKINEVSGRHGSLPLQLPKGIYIVNGKKVVVK